MLATKTQFTCQECGASQPKWHGRCPSCSAWASMVEEAVPPGGQARRPGRRAGAQAAAARRRRGDPTHDRLPTGIDEFDRVLGGGLVPGSLILIGGDPGIGKSTLTTMALARLAARAPVLLVCGEESPAQVRMRAERIGGAGRIGVIAETDLDLVCQTLVQEQPAVAVIDSVQTLWANDLASAPGSVAQVREAAGRLLRVAKEHAITVILVGHVTKDGAVAGPRVLEHLVDAVLLFEGDRTGDLRVLRAAKNRFGSTSRDRRVRDDLAPGWRRSATRRRCSAAATWAGRDRSSPAPSRARGRCCSRCRRWSRRATCRCRAAWRPASTATAWR